MNPKVDWYFQKESKWQEEVNMLREICLSTGLNEELKWGCPCYALGKANIVLIHEFKEYCALLFFKGALLNNDHGLMIRQTENVQAARQIRFTAIGDITKNKDTLRSCICEAIEVEKAGLKVPHKETAKFSIPEEFQVKLDELPVLKAAFEGLTPGRQRAYLLHFSQAKQAKTRESRIVKYIPQILDGKGLDD